MKNKDIFQESLLNDYNKVKTMKLTMLDNVSLVRNIVTVAEIVTNIQTVILHDLLLDTAGWVVMSDAFANPDKTLRRLELFQILGISSDNVTMIGKCLRDTPEIVLKSSGRLGIQAVQTEEMRKNEIFPF